MIAERATYAICFLIVSLTVPQKAVFATELAKSIVPQARPVAAPLNVSTAQQGNTVSEMAISILPTARPKGLTAPTVQAVKYRSKGSVCGVKEIRGTLSTAIPAKLQGCGLDGPVHVTEISGVTLSRPATIDCTTAKALHKWVEKGAKPAAKRIGGGLSSLTVVASYACRPRNNIPGAKVSEHGRGRAIDIAGVTFKNGDVATVLKGWNSRAYGKMFKKMHKSACGPFGTVLGPNANKYHKDHFHFDTARYRSGSYCR
ncbi:extensin-like protein [Pacificibacter maritimus]|uniref:Extensin-like protein n=1 Tax=Pacificibacter maritimus TaxID=762213 RepID=A0A3N4U8U3_9RHOB|nr:extensin family protein [Pacificibacter maritimus]RPE67153.1 extensin-like protein [Pacificibacter maritimus]